VSTKQAEDINVYVRYGQCLNSNCSLLTVTLSNVQLAAEATDMRPQLYLSLCTLRNDLRCG